MSKVVCTSEHAARLHPCFADSVPGQKWYKPIICTLKDTSGRKRVFKTYRYRQGILGLYFRLLASHEFRMLSRVQGLPFTPQRIERDSQTMNTVSYGYVDGVPIKGAFQDGTMPGEFFLSLYEAVHQLHEAGVVHLDLGNSGNVLVSLEGNPVLIDFGSAIPLDRLPSLLRCWARKKDLLGLLKLWDRFDAPSMPEYLRDYYRRHYRKNIYTPKRFFRAFKRYWVSDGEDMTGIGTMTGLFLAMLFLVSIL